MRVLGIAVAAAALVAAAFWLARGETGGTRGSAGRGGYPDRPGGEQALVPKPDTAPHWLVGRVTGAEPLDGVEVRAVWRGGASAVSTDYEGRYRIPAPNLTGKRTLRLRADAPDGRVAVGFGVVAEEKTVHRQPDLRMGPGGEVLFRTEPATASAQVRAEWLTEFDDGTHGNPLPLAAGFTGAAGTLRVRLPVGRCRAWAHAKGYGRAGAEFDVTAQGAEFLFRLLPERRLKVAVRDKGGQVPVAGAELRVFVRREEYGSPVAVTDEHGESWLTGLNPADKPLKLQVRPPGEPRRSGQTFSIPPDAQEMVVELESPRAISWDVLDGDIPAPPDGTQVELEAMPGSPVNPPPLGRMENGRLVVAGWPAGNAAGLAIGPGRTKARLWAGAADVEGRPTKFMRTVDVHVRVRNADGTPAPGVEVGIFGGGNNMLAGARTDATGLAKLDGLSGSFGTLRVLGRSPWMRLDVIGAVDLRKGDLLVEHVLRRRFAIEVRAVFGGKPIKPTGFSAYGFQHSSAKFDEQQGLLTGVILPQKGRSKVWLKLHVPGFLAEQCTLALPEGDEPIRYTFPLRKGHALRVREIGEGPKEYRVCLERKYDAGWQTIDDPSRQPREFIEKLSDGYRYAALEAATYRLVAKIQGEVLGVARVGPGAEPEIAVDYTKVRYVKGRVEVPEGFDFESVGVEAIGERSIFERKIRVRGKQGTFSAIVPGDRVVRLRARHPLLAPGDVWEGTGGGEGIVLRLVAGPSLRFGIRGYVGKGSRIAVRLFVGEPRGRPAFSVVARFGEGSWTAGGFPKGTYTAWIDVPEALPQVRRGVRFDGGQVDLGDLAMEAGSRLRVRVLVRQPFVVPRVYVYAHRDGEPKYTRSASAEGEEFVVVSGLAAGKYRVTGNVSNQIGTTPFLMREIEVDGVTDLEIDYDLRY